MTDEELSEYRDHIKELQDLHQECHVAWEQRLERLKAAAALWKRFAKRSHANHLHASKMNRKNYRRYVEAAVERDELKFRMEGLEK